MSKPVNNSPGIPLCPALSGDRSNLSPEGSARIRKLLKPEPVRFIFELATAWVIIVIAAWVAFLAQNFWISLFAIYIIATRQNILGLLVHEQAHYLGLRSRWGDLFTNLFAAYPLFISTESYAGVHLTHHKFYFTSKDPDHLRKQGEEWKFPMKIKLLIQFFLTDLSGANIIKTLRGKQAGEEHTMHRKITIPKWIRPAWYLILVTLITLTHNWPLFLMYWLLPLLTFLQAFVRWGAICEHKYNMENAGLIETTPIIILKWWEKLLLPNLNFTMHIYHHFWPGIAFCNLPKVHRIFQDEGLVIEKNVYHGYWQYLKSLLNASAIVEKNQVVRQII